MEKLISDFSVGLFFWQSVLFIALVLLLRKFAWRPTLNALNERERFIAESLESAKRAKDEMRKLKESNEGLLQEARAERDKLMKEARETKDQIINEAKNKAKEEADKVLAASREEIKNEKTKALEELKAQVAGISFEIAEKVLAEKLADADKQSASIKKALSEIRFN